MMAALPLVFGRFDGMFQDMSRMIYDSFGAIYFLAMLKLLEG